MRWLILSFAFLAVVYAANIPQSNNAELDDGDAFVQEAAESSAPHNSGVVSESAQEELKQKQKDNPEEELDTANVATGKDALKPKIEVLYTPKHCRRKSVNGDLMVVHYTGWLKKSGKKFDTTVDVRRRYTPFEFVLGTGYVVRGWELGLLDMCPGEKRRLEVPAELGYGAKGLRGIIPANATLTFLVDLLDLRRATPNYAPIDLFTSLDKDGDAHLSRDEISQYVKYQSKMYRNKNAPPPNDEEHEQMVDDIMLKEDKDKDGKISHKEFSGPKSPKTEL